MLILTSGIHHSLLFTGTGVHGHGEALAGLHPGQYLLRYTYVVDTTLLEPQGLKHPLITNNKQTYIMIESRQSPNSNPSCLVSPCQSQSPLVVISRSYNQAGSLSSFRPYFIMWDMRAYQYFYLVVPSIFFSSASSPRFLPVPNVGILTASFQSWILVFSSSDPPR